MGLNPEFFMPKPKAPNRPERVAQQILRELAELIRHELKDPRLGFVTLTDVEVTRDYSHAKVFYTLLNGDEAASQATLDRSAGFLRSELGRRIQLFTVPQLKFVYDRSVEHGTHLSALIEQAAQHRAQDDEPQDE
jgi:ribosome-binding factor A